MINEFPIDFLDLRESPIAEEIFDVEDKMERFYLTIDFDTNEDLKSQCLDARNYLDSCRILVRNLLDKEENEYIGKYKKKFDWMLDNLGRVDKKMDDIEKETIEKIEDYEIGTNKIILDNSRIRKYINYLIKCMEHLVYYPLIKSYNYFKEKEISGRDLFLYWVFVDLYNSSESIGSISSEPVRTFPKHGDISNTKSSHEDSDDANDEQENYFQSPEEIQKQKEDPQELSIRQVFEETQMLEEEAFQ